MGKHVKKDGRALAWGAALLLCGLGGLAALAAKRTMVDDVSVRYLQPREHVLDIMTRLGRRVGKDPNALYVLSEATTACTPMARDWLRRRGMPPADRAFWRWQMHFCDRIEQSRNSWRYRYGVFVEMRGRHPGWDVVQGKEAGYAQSLYAGLSRDAPASELRLAAFVLVADSAGMPPGQRTRLAWRYGRDTVARVAHPERLPQYQRMALRLVECDLLGGCGPNGLLSFELCREEHDCRWGVSVDDILHDRFSAQEMAIIQTLHRRLSDERNFYARSHLSARSFEPLEAPEPSYRNDHDEEAWLAHWNARHIGRLSVRRAHATAVSPRSPVIPR